MNKELIKKIEELIPIELRKDKYNKYDLLGLSVELTDKYEFKTAFKLRKIAEQININDTINNRYEDKTFISIEKSIISHIFYNDTKYNEEYFLYEPIKHYINELIENAEIVEHDIINKKFPDIFLSVNNEFCVGEVKSNVFSNTNVNQLRMYMETYGTRIGYAFGLKLTGFCSYTIYYSSLFKNFIKIKMNFNKINLIL
jgi:hypothetical protein